MVKDFIIDIVKILKIGANRTRVGVVTFSTQAKNNIYLNQFDTQVHVCYTLSHVYGYITKHFFYIVISLPV